MMLAGVAIHQGCVEMDKMSPGLGIPGIPQANEQTFFVVTGECSSQMLIFWEEPKICARGQKVSIQLLASVCAMGDTSGTGIDTAEIVRLEVIDSGSLV